MNNLLDAVQKNNLTEVQSLINEGHDIHINHDLPLRTAASLGLNKMVNLLIELGANVHVENEGPLRLAIINRDVEMVKLLLKAGSKITDDELINQVKNKEIKKLLLN